MSAILRIGDLDRDGREDLVARQASTGELWFYPGTATGFGSRTRIGTRWNGMRELTAIGDFDSDGYPDLLAADVAGTGLFVYPGRPGPALGPRVQVGGTGWDAMSELAGVGDFTRDGITDLVARATASGTLYLYPGRAGGFAARRQIGTGWTGMRDLVGPGDVNRDGFTDLTAVNSAGIVYLYQGNGAGIALRTQLATGFAGRSPML